MSNYEICQEMGQNFIDYAYAVNTDRSIPSAADGLKPVHRRILWSMYKEKNTSDKAHVKCARIVGDVIGKYHPHGDTSVYDAMTRLAQEWNMRYPLINWHGNKGNVGGDGAAAMRYTEARLESLAQEGMLQNLNKNIIDMQPNYSEDLEEPTLLPAIFPNLLCNPNSGIGVAMACNWLPYNFKELTEQVLIPHLRQLTTDYENILPDFPTGGNIINPKEAKNINITGRGKVIVEGKYKIENRNGKQLIVFYEIPYGVKIEYEEQGKAKGIIPQLRQAIREEKMPGVSDVRDESSKTIRIVIELSERDTNIESTIARIYSYSDLRKSYSANQIALVGKTPRLLNLFQVVKIYSEHNLNCIKREFEFEFNKTKDRIEILEGLIWAVEHIDEVIEYIREGISLCKLTDFINPRQEKAILDMKLGRLSNLEQEKLEKELQEKKEYLEYCQTMIKNDLSRRELLIERLTKLVKLFGDNRRTTTEPKEMITIKSGTTSKGTKVIIPEDVCISFTNSGYIKSVPTKIYKQSAADKTAFKTQTTELILLFSSLGKMYRLKVDAIKQCESKDKGVAAGALVNLEKDEKILNVFSMNIDEKHPYIIGVTKYGQVKKSDKTIYIGSTQNKNGLKAAGLKENDVYIGFWESNGDYITLTTAKKYAIQFEMEKINPVGKTAKGVIGIKLEDDDYVTDVKLSATPNKNIQIQGRGGKGKKIAV